MTFSVAGIEKTAEQIVAEAQAAYVPLKALLAVIPSFVLPPGVPTAIKDLDALMTAAPKLLKDLEQLANDTVVAWPT